MATVVSSRVTELTKQSTSLDYSVRRGKVALFSG